jgi:hypothetical protein
MVTTSFRSFSLETLYWSSEGDASRYACGQGVEFDIVGDLEASERAVSFLLRDARKAAVAGALVSLEPSPVQMAVCSWPLVALASGADVVAWQPHPFRAIRARISLQCLAFEVAERSLWVVGDATVGRLDEGETEWSLFSLSDHARDWRVDGPKLVVDTDDGKSVSF